MLPSFEVAWARYEQKGYKYGPDALEQVRLGYRMAQEELTLMAQAAQAQPQQCTKENPMPKGSVEPWAHPEAIVHAPVGSPSKLFICPHCQTRWRE